MRKGVCKHYNRACTVERGDCEAGINTRELVGGEDFGWLTRTPCLVDNKSQIKCPKFEEPTDDEVAAFEAESDRRLNNVFAALKLVDEIKPKPGTTGAVECPVCQGKVNWSCSSHNGHVWGKCETEDCVAWME